MEEVEKKRIAVIGAGVCGLPAIKHCLEEGMEPVCFEQREDLGGLWNYVDKAIKGRSSVMKSTISNTCKETYCYSDFPVPDNFPVFMPHEKVVQYMRLYAAKFDLERHIRYNSEVTEVKQDENFSTNGRWCVTVKNENSGDITTETYDGVMVCNGHHSVPYTPQYRGQDAFRGVQIHSNEYRDFKPFEGKRVVIVGMGNSASEIACELSRHSKQVYLSTYRGSWIMGRLAGGGIPFDLQYNRLVVHKVVPKIPTLLRDYIWAKLVNVNFDHKMFALEPKHGFDSQNPLVNDELPSLLSSGRIIIKDGIDHLTETGVVIQDGSNLDAIDAVIYGTGYDFGFPFVKHKAFEIKNYQNDFYQFVFAPEIEPPTLAVIGCVQTFGSIMAAGEIESRWAAKVLAGKSKLPSKDKMYEDIKLKHAIIKHFYLDTMRHKIHYDWIEHLYNIGDELGCSPNIKSLITTDPRLACALFFGPTLPSHFRLFGPGAWPPARETILSLWDRVVHPLRTRRVVTGNWRYVGTVIKLIIVFIVCIWLFLF